MNFRELVLLVAMIATIIPIVAILLRGQTHRLVILATVLAAASTNCRA